MVIIDLHTVSLWIVGILIISFDFVVYIGSDKTSSKLFSLFSIPVALWSISYGLMVSLTQLEFSLILIKLNHVLGLIASIGFLFFSVSYPNDKPINKLLITVSVIFGVIYSYIILFSSLMIKFMYPISLPDRWGWSTGIIYFSYPIIFLTLWIIILTNLYNKKNYLVTKNEKLNQQFMFWGLCIGIIPPFVLNIFLPAFHIYGISWTGPIFSAIWVFIIGYSIMRYRQMNVRVVITEMLAISLTIIFFINIFIKAQFGVIENVLTFLVFLLLAIFLIRGVLVEVKQKEKLRDLNENLESKVAEQTLEIRKAFELEKHARRELEKLNDAKNQFIMITQHSLRSPINQIQIKFNELQSIKNYEKLNLHFPIISKNIDRLMNITNDFLGIVSINKSSSILNLAQISLLPILEKTLEELSYDIKSKNITVEYNNSLEKWPKLNIDESKIFEVLLIIIENAIKYNVINGSIKIIPEIINDNFNVSIRDSGTGIPKEDTDKILNRLFYRSNMAKQMNPNGMGIGLSVAKAILQAHHGTIKINSMEINKGTEVTITIPINYLI
jgi:signal transduction histidine kinase